MEWWNNGVKSRSSIFQYSSVPIFRFVFSFVFHWPAITADQNKAIGMFLLVSRAVALGEQTPRGGQLLPAAAGFGFACATTVGMVDRITRDTAVDRANAAMTGPACFAENDVFMLGVADLTDGGVAIFVNAPNFARGKANLGVAFVARHEGGSATGGADHLSTATGSQLDVVNRKADRDRAKGKRIANVGRSGGPADQFRADLETGWRDDVSLLAVLILEQGKPGTATGIVFNCGNSRFDAMLLPFEIDDAGFLFVSATNAARGATTIMIASAGAFANFDQALFGLGFRDIAEIGIRDVARRWRKRSKCFNWHKSTKRFPKPSQQLGEQNH
jgi:hypothetical protein